MPKVSTASTKDDVEINQIALRNTHFQTVARSWLNDALGAPIDDSIDDSDVKSPAGDELELRPDLEGVGFIPPPDDHRDNLQRNHQRPSSSASTAATEKLRRQLLGDSSGRRGNKVSNNIGLVGSTPRPGHQHQQQHQQQQQGQSKQVLARSRYGFHDYSDDAEESRSSLGKQKQRQLHQQQQQKTKAELQIDDQAKLPDASSSSAGEVAEQAQANKVNNDDGESSRMAGRGTKRVAAGTNARGSHSYLDQVLAERAAKRSRKMNKKSLEIDR